MILRMMGAKMAKEIKIRIYPDGRIVSETIGIKGKSCVNQMENIENITKAAIVNSEFTKEYNEIEEQSYTYQDNYQYGEN